MKCDNCSNYQVHPSGTDDGYYTACKECSGRLSKVYKQEVMDEERSNCIGFERI